MACNLHLRHVLTIRMGEKWHVFSFSSYEKMLSPSLALTPNQSFGLINPTIAGRFRDSHNCWVVGDIWGPEGRALTASPNGSVSPKYGRNLYVCQVVYRGGARPGELITDLVFSRKPPLACLSLQGI